MTVGSEMPRYKCYKEVHALKIAAVDRHTTTPASKGYAAVDRYTITPADDGYAPFPVSNDYIDKHDPLAGGYYIVYADGYKSYSLAKAFEDGYKRIT